MKRFLLILICLPWYCQALADASDKDVRRLDRAAFVINEIMQTPDQGIPQGLFDKAVCVGIIPSQLKLAFGVGGAYGRGALVCRRGGNGPWGAPSLFTLGGANFGFQIGGQATDVVFLVMNAEGAKKLLESGVKLGADASVAAGPVGRSAEGATDVQLHAQILSYSRSRGLFAGVSLAGTVMKAENENNANLYESRVTPSQILIEGKVQPPAAARHLDEMLTKYSPKGGSPFSTD